MISRRGFLAALAGLSAAITGGWRPTKSAVKAGPAIKGLMTTDSFAKAVSRSPYRPAFTANMNMSELGKEIGRSHSQARDFFAMRALKVSRYT